MSPMLLSTIAESAPNNPALAYGAVASGLALFGTMFFVIPQFKDSFRQGVTWNEVYDSLVSEGGVKAVQPSEAFAKASKGG